MTSSRAEADGKGGGVARARICCGESDIVGNGAPPLMDILDSLCVVERPLSSRKCGCRVVAASTMETSGSSRSAPHVYARTHAHSGAA
jgi:hypothetical protein